MPVQGGRQGGTFMSVVKGEEDDTSDFSEIWPPVSLALSNILFPLAQISIQCTGGFMWEAFMKLQQLQICVDC